MPTLLTDDTPPPAAPNQRELRARNRRALWIALIARTPRLYATPILFIINVAVYLGMVASGVDAFDARTSDLVAWGGEYGPLTLSGEWWRLVTSQFVHAGILHLLMNMICLGFVGPVVERLTGGGSMALLYIASGLVAAALSLAVHPNLVAVGASGAIMGLYGLLLAFVLSPVRDPLDEQAGRVPVALLVDVASSAAAGFVATVAAGFLMPRVNNAAHVGGFIAGYLFGALFGRRIQWLPIRPRNAAAALAAAIAICLVPLAGVTPPPDPRVSNPPDRGVGNQVGQLLLEAMTLESTSMVSYHRMVREKAPLGTITKELTEIVIPQFRGLDQKLVASGTTASSATARQLHDFVIQRTEMWQLRVQGHVSGNAQDLARASTMEQASDDLRRTLLYSTKP